MRKTDSKGYWDNRAKSYSEVNQEELVGVQRNTWKDLLEEQISSAFGDKDRSQIRILDIGAGPGFLSIVLAELGYTVTAADYSVEMMTEAKKNAESCDVSIRFVRENAMDLSFREGCYDVVISRNLIWNLENPKKAYQEWLRVLKPSGMLLVFDANWYTYLRDENSRKAYDRDRENVSKSGFEDYNIGENFDQMEEIANHLPMTDVSRPQWDKEVLLTMGIEGVETVLDIGSRVYSEKEKVNYRSTPMFMIKAMKG